MKVEALTVCVGRSSFLRETLAINKDKVDNFVVVTTPTDYETQRVCKEQGAQIVETDVFYQYGAPFDKGRAINKGLQELKYNDWVVLTDCDIVFMPPHKKMFQDNSLDKECMYGCPRIVLETKKDFKDFLIKAALGGSGIDINSLIKQDIVEIGVGFFQLFNLNSKIIETIKDSVVYADQETFEEMVLPAVNGDESYPRVFKDEGVIYPYFPTAGGSDSHFRHFFMSKNAIIGSQIPVIHLGKPGNGHGGMSMNFQ